jgi:organic radical activating enzyme
MLSKTFCKMPFVGLQATHKGSRLCCDAKKSEITGIKDFWYSNYREDVKNKMLKGEKVADCESCYKKEAQGKISLRNHYNRLYKNLPIETQPTALDLDLSNLCNLRCIMCGPNRSSQWTKELGKKTLAPISKEQINELCQLSDHVQHLTIQGGEPSIMPEFEYYFQHLKERKLIDRIEIDCISNLTNINNKFYELLEDFKAVNINASVDAYGSVNDYIRFPSKFHNLGKNLLALSKKKMQVNLQITLQTLSMYNFYDFLVWISNIQKQYIQKNKALGLNISYVSNPNYLDMKNAPEKLKEKIILDIKKFRSEGHDAIKDVGFNVELRNIEQRLFTDHPPRYIKELKDYLNTLDNRRNIKITNYIPDLYEYI